jgi:uncharacterized membrane protein AbrB (regulator of aidB expression)
MREALKAKLAALRKHDREVLLSLCVAGGVAMIAYGVSLWSVPAAWIIGGLGLVGVAYLVLAEA